MRQRRTDADGYYLFDNLGPGDYVVEIDKSNFLDGQLLSGYTTSWPTEDDPNGDGDDNDNGLNSFRTVTGGTEINPAETGVRSAVVTLTASLSSPNEPEGEADRGPEGDGAVAFDWNSNLTVDFGLVPAVSVGNRVWFDSNDNGVQDIGEDGIAGVELHLLYADNSPVTDVNGTALTTTTDADGHYLFDNLPPNIYKVFIPNSNFTYGTGPLSELISSRVTETSPDSDIDRNDNGLDDAQPSTNGIYSNTINLMENNLPEPDDETDLGAQQHGSVPDERSNLTLDFGFFEPVSLGNRVWFRHQRRRESTKPPPKTEPTTCLCACSTAAAIGPRMPMETIFPMTSTHDGGYYLFDLLKPGSYIVEIVADNFKQQRDERCPVQLFQHLYG